MIRRSRVPGSIITAIAICLSVAATRAQELPIDRAREECRQQFDYLRGPGQREVVAAHVRECVQTKMQEQFHAADVAPTEGVQPIRLTETNAWLVGPPKGPARAKGVIYFVAGYATARAPLNDFRMVPYFIKSMAGDGWDVVRARVPDEIVGGLGREFVSGGARTIRQRAAELKASGYKHVVVAGHSWGAWAAMLAAGDGFAADAVILSAPNTFGPAIGPLTGKPNPGYRLVVTEFAPALSNDKVPTVLILPDDNVWDPDPAARGQIAEQYFARTHIPHIVIAKPPGFFGHYAGFLPIFDYAYGACLRAFLANPGSVTSCSPPPLANTDFRAIANLKQVADANSRRIVSTAPLVGRKFVAYTLRDLDNKRYDYVTPAERATMLSDRVVREQVVFNEGQQCAGSACSVLMRWSDHEILEFDPGTGGIKAWWIEDTPVM